MESYEPIKNFDEDDEDVEMAIHQISESRSATIGGQQQQQQQQTRPNINNTTKIVQELSPSSSKHQPQPQPQPQTRSQRLVSLDVFRGLTVAVTFSLLPLLHHIPCLSVFLIFNYYYYFTYFV